MIDELLKLSAYELSAKFSKKEISPVEVYNMTITAINKLNPDLNAFTVIDDGRHLKNAQEAEKRWMNSDAISIFDGVPVTIKDCFNLKGWPTHMGSKTLDEKTPVNNNAVCTDLIQRTGAVVMGKTTMPDLFWKITTESSQTGVTRNPWNKERTPGGSSGGSAAATAAGLGYIGLSTDGAGSIRVPASFCGLVGIKPSNGIIPYTPPNKAGDYAACGPIGRSVRDVAAMTSCLQHRTPKDPWTLRTPQQDFFTYLEEGIDGFKIAHTSQLSLPYDPDYEVIKTVEESLGAFNDLGATIYKNIEFLSESRMKTLLKTHEILRLSSLYSIIEDIPEEKKINLDKELYKCSQLGKNISLHECLNAEVDRRLISATLCEFFEEYDALIVPTIHRTAYPVSNPAYPLNDISLPPLSLVLFNMTSLPAITVPCGLSKEGMPIGLQIVGGPNQDAKLLRIARAFEKAYSFPYFKFYKNIEGENQ